MARASGMGAAVLLGWALWTAQGAAGQEPIDGVCNEGVRNGCAAGRPNDAVFPDSQVVHVWRCDGLNGGANSEKCVLYVSVDGVCDESVRNGCSAGRPNDGAFPDRPDMYAWRCDGLNAGANSGRCVKFLPVDGACDESVRNGCSAGTANDDAFPDTPNGYLWRCDGEHGGANSDKCFMRMPVDGVCDESVRNGCSAGTANDDAFPDTPNGYLWRCDGERGGANSDKCFIRVQDVPVDGVCDETVRNGCSSGTANDAAFADIATAYLWRCDGEHGGANSDKCFKRRPVDGVCDESARNGCSSGTANDAAFADTTSHYRWRCDGDHGGSNSATCSLAKPPPAQVSCGGAWSPSASTVCSGQSLIQTRTCNAGCNDGDCSTSRSATGTKSCVTCGGAWSPSPATVCSGQSFTQTRTCNAGCNDGDCATSRSATGMMHCVTASITCGGAWSPSRSTVCSGQSFTQTRSCRSGCNTGNCATIRTLPGTKSCVTCGSGAWSPSPDTVCTGDSFTQTRSCNAGCNTGDCSTSRSEPGAREASDCVWGPWSQWSDWTDCSVSCDGGTQSSSRTRSKTAPAACGGACPGSATETRSQACNTHDCPVECGRDPWSPGVGSVCAGQSFTQTRTCNAGCNTGDCTTTRPATGTKPPSDCQWGSWGQWSDWGACSATCGGGTQSRSRTRGKTVTEACGGSCPGSSTATESRSCNTQSCSVPATLCGSNRNCVSGATWSYGDCPDNERGTPGHCFWFCTLGDRTETCDD